MKATENRWFFLARTNDYIIYYEETAEITIHAAIYVVCCLSFKHMSLWAYNNNISTIYYYYKPVILKIIFHFAIK